MDQLLHQTCSLGSETCSSYWESSSRSSSVKTVLAYRNHKVTKPDPEKVPTSVQLAMARVKSELGGAPDYCSKLAIAGYVISVVNNSDINKGLYIAPKNKTEHEQPIKEFIPNPPCWHERLDALIEQYKDTQDKKDIKTSWRHRLLRNPFTRHQSSHVSHLCKEMKNHLPDDTYKSIHKYYKAGTSKQKLENLAKAIKSHGGDEVVTAFEKAMGIQHTDALNQDTQPHSSGYSLPSPPLDETKNVEVTLEDFKPKESESNFATIRRTPSGSSRRHQLRGEAKQNLPATRHSHAGGNPPRTMDPRLRGDDDGKKPNASPLRTPMLYGTPRLGENTASTDLLPHRSNHNAYLQPQRPFSIAEEPRRNKPEEMTRHWAFDSRRQTSGTQCQSSESRPVSLSGTLPTNKLKPLIPERRSSRASTISNYTNVRADQRPSGQQYPSTHSYQQSLLEYKYPNLDPDDKEEDYSFMWGSPYYPESPEEGSFDFWSSSSNAAQPSGVLPPLSSVAGVGSSNTLKAVLIESPFSAEPSSDTPESLLDEAKSTPPLLCSRFPTLV